MMGNKTKQVVLTVFSAGALLLGSPAACEALSLDGVPFRSQHGPVRTTCRDIVTIEDRFIGRLSASARLMAQSPLFTNDSDLAFPHGIEFVSFCTRRSRSFSLTPFFACIKSPFRV